MILRAYVLYILVAALAGDSGHYSADRDFHPHRAHFDSIYETFVV